MKKEKIVAVVLSVLCLVILISGCNSDENKDKETTVVSEATTEKEVFEEVKTTEKNSEKETIIKEEKTDNEETTRKEETTKKIETEKSSTTKQSSVTKKPSTTKTPTTEKKNYTEKEVRDDGSIKETLYENGKVMNIKYKTADGKLKELIEYTYHKNGKMKTEKRQTFSDKGELSYGTTINEYNENGVRIRNTFITTENIKTVDEYNSSKQKTNSYYYDKNGNMIQKTNYRDGKRTEEIWYNGRGGSVSSVVKYWEDGRTKKAHEYYENGQKYSEIIYDRNGIKLDTVYYY